jgi:hypothetical protein
MRSRILVPFDERFSVFGRELVKSAGKRITRAAIKWAIESMAHQRSDCTPNKVRSMRHSGLDFLALISSHSISFDRSPKSFKAHCAR